MSNIGFTNYDDSVNRNCDVAEKYTLFSQIVQLNTAYYGQKAARLMDYHGVNGKKLADENGFSSSMFSRMKKPQFTVSPTFLTFTCYRVFHMSCHDFIFEKKDQPTILPRSLAFVAKAMSKKSINEKTSILRHVKKIRFSYEQEIGECTFSTAALPGIRYKEYAKEQYLPESVCLNKSAGVPVSRRMARAASSQEHSTDPLRLETLIYVTWVTGTTMDYFLIQDYTQYQPIGYYQGSDVVEVTDALTVEVISNLLHLPDEQQAECIAYITYHFT